VGLRPSGRCITDYRFGKCKHHIQVPYTFSQPQNVTLTPKYRQGPEPSHKCLHDSTLPSASPATDTEPLIPDRYASNAKNPALGTIQGTSADPAPHANNHRIPPSAPPPRMSALQLQTAQHFTVLKSQIISLAAALYGTTSTPSGTFDVLPFSTPRTTPNGTRLNSSLTHGAALIYYTGPTSAPYVSWEMISYADNQASVNAGAQQLLEDMQSGVGDVISKSLLVPASFGLLAWFGDYAFVGFGEVLIVQGGLVKRGDWAVRHKTVPDLAMGEQHDDGEGVGHGDEGYSNGVGEERWGQPLGDISEAEEYAQRGRTVR
jgi:hypothetical protein